MKSDRFTFIASDCRLQNSIALTKNFNLGGYGCHYINTRMQLNGIKCQNEKNAEQKLYYI